MVTGIGVGIFKARMIDTVYDPDQAETLKVFAVKGTGQWGCEAGLRMARFIDVLEYRITPGDPEGPVSKQKVFGYEVDCPWRSDFSVIQREVNPPCGVTDKMQLEIRFTGVNLCEPTGTAECVGTGTSTDTGADTAIRQGQCPDVLLTHDEDSNTWMGSVCFRHGKIDFTLSPPGTVSVSNWNLSLAGCSEEPGGDMEVVCHCPLVLFRPWAVPTACCDTAVGTPRTAAFWVRSYTRPPAARFVDVIPYQPPGTSNPIPRKVWAWMSFGCRRCDIPTVTNNCCPAGVSVRLLCTITNSECPCIPDQQFEVVYVPASGFWQGTGVTCIVDSGTGTNVGAGCDLGSSGSITLACNAALHTWSVQGGGCFQFLITGSVTAASCHPMLLSFSAHFGLGGCAGANLTITFTEVP